MADGALARPVESEELLYVVVPVYNEEASVARVVREWASALDSLGACYRFLLLDDGSKDGTRDQLDALASELPRIEVIHKPNSGHGQTCVEGYRTAVARGASWVLQIDSDGQCDPGYFSELWHRRARFGAVFGKRVTREDGVSRRLVSWFCRHATRLVSGVAVQDPNVPYRLIRADVLSAAIAGLPQDFWLANVLVAVVVQKGLGERIGFVEINFRDRYGGEASAKWLKFVSSGLDLCRALYGTRAYTRERALAIAGNSR
ncbi:MAG TPA: glycosyltransferase family 2 protein [Polyangiaceae bacterium]|nr:glycosyltransferase family 2 protein [Polyangiaceae bacterium]